MRSPNQETAASPKGLGAKHEADGILELLREFEPGLTNIEGFSHLFVIWAFDRSDGFELIGRPPARGHRRLRQPGCSPGAEDGDANPVRAEV